MCAWHFTWHYHPTPRSQWCRQGVGRAVSNRLGLSDAKMCFAISSDSELNQVNKLLQEWADSSAAYVLLN